MEIKYKSKFVEEFVRRYARFEIRETLIGLLEVLFEKEIINWDDLDRIHFSDKIIESEAEINE